ncbi:MAG: fibronectin type III domain-containing protein [Oscillospiraceae bacterium]|nr:fibronectin type III domain-containing protein [Oscillospiraceae bacterium]
MRNRSVILALTLAGIMSFGITAPAEISPSVSVSAAAQLAAPKGMSTTDSSGTVSIKWDAVSGADAYRVYVYDASSRKWKKYKTVTGTVCSLKDLRKGNTYYFMISALEKNGKSYNEGKKTAKFKVSIPAAVAKKDMPKMPDITDYGFTDRTAKFSGKYTSVGRSSFEAEYDDLQDIVDWENERNKQFKDYYEKLLSLGYVLKASDKKVTESDMARTTKIDLKIYYNGKQVGTIRRSFTQTKVKGSKYKGGMKLSGVDEIYILMK